MLVITRQTSSIPRRAGAAEGVGGVLYERDEVASVTPHEANECLELDPDTLFIDPRDISDIQSTTGLIPGALNITLEQLSETANDELSGERIVYRLLCASRNITFDRSWDTMLALEGGLSNHPRSLRVNRPLASFVAQLPNLAVPGNSTKALKRAEALVVQMGDELQRVEFELPDGFDEFRFWPLGIDDSPWPFGEWVDRLAIVSPFLSDSMLRRLSDQAGEVSLVSRVESLEGVNPSVFEEYEDVLFMDPGADAEDVHEVETQAVEAGVE